MSYQNTPQATPLAPNGGSTSTVHIWLIVGLFALQTIASFFYLATLDLSGYVDAAFDSASNSSDPSSVFALYSFILTPAYIALMVLSVLAYLGTAALAYFDSRGLLARGVDRPFPWALAFIPSYGSLVYLIGRSVAVRRRTGGGLAPLWVYIAIFAIGIIASLIWAVVIIGDLFSSIPGGLGY